MAVACVVGALACQKDSYRRSLEARVVSCLKSEPIKTKSKSKSPAVSPPATWLIEFDDSVLFPEGGGQPSDYGTLLPLSDSTSEPVPITFVERQGLRCIIHSPKPLEVGALIRQEIDFQRRWDHMQQHTGQHLLSAIMDSMNIETLGWGIGKGDDPSYVDISHKPTPEQILEIQAKCNEAIRNNHKITVETPTEDEKIDHHIPEDYDTAKGVIRVIKIEGIDANPCCGTHLSQTSHLSVILLHASQPIHTTQYRFFFSIGDRAIKHAVSSIQSLRAVAGTVSTGTRPEEVLAGVKRISTNAAESRSKASKLLSEIATYEGARVKTMLESGKSAWVHRPAEGMDFLNMVVFEVKDVGKGMNVVVLASGETGKTGQVVIIGEKSKVEDVAANALGVVEGLKGGGRGERWQGKVIEWKKGQIAALKGLVES